MDKHHALLVRTSGRPKKTWERWTENDMADDSKERNTWISGVRTAMRAASQLL